MKLSHEDINNRMEKCTKAIMKEFPNTGFLLTIDLGEQIIVGSNDDKALAHSVAELLGHSPIPPQDLN